MLIIEEVADRRIEAAELSYAVGAGAMAESAGVVGKAIKRDLCLGGEKRAVIADLAGVAEAAASEGAEVGQIGGGARFVACDPGRRPIGEFRAQIGEFADSERESGSAGGFAAPPGICNLISPTTFFAIKNLFAA